MLGRFRVIDRLLHAARGDLPRVRSAMRGQESDPAPAYTAPGRAEMLDAVRPDEYRQRLRAVRSSSSQCGGNAGSAGSTAGPGRAEWLHGLSGRLAAAVSVAGVWLSS